MLLYRTVVAVLIFLLPWFKILWATTPEKTIEIEQHENKDTANLHTPLLVSHISQLLNDALNHEEQSTIDSIIDYVVDQEDFNNDFVNAAPLDQIEFYQTVMQIMEVREDFKRAYYYALQAHKINDSLFKEIYNDQIQSLENLYKLKIDSLNQNHQDLALTFRTQKRYILSGAAALLFLITLMTSVICKQRKIALRQEIKRLDELNAKTNKELQKEKDFSMLKDKIIKEKDSDLIIQSTERFRLQEEFEQIEALLKKEKIPHVNKEIKRIKGKDNQNWWSTIDKFKALNPVLLVNLSRPEHELTRSEIEFCILAAMQLTNKEIGNILNISTSSVATKKYRLVKKLKLNNNIDFETWLSKQHV